MIAALLIACMAVPMLSMSADARAEARWALQSGDVLVGEDWSIQKPQASLFHSATESLADNEQTSLSFPTALGFAPSQDTNMALPHISQAVDETADAVDTGFFNANWCYLNAPNNGGGPVLANDATSAHPFASSKMLGSEFLFPYMTPIQNTRVNFKPVIDGSNMVGLSGDDQQFTLKKAEFVPSNMTNTTGVTMANQTGNQTGPSLPQGPRKPRVDPKSTRDQIKNMTTMKRMYRDAFVGTTMHLASQGPVQSPTWISPNEHPGDVTKMKNHFQTNKDGLNMTAAGTHLTPVFWDL